jgi:hypothetical protein
MCPSGETYLPADCCYSELAQNNATKRCVGLVQIRYHHHRIECNLFSRWYSCKITHVSLDNNHSITQLLINQQDTSISHFWGAISSECIIYWEIYITGNKWHTVRTIPNSNTTILEIEGILILIAHIDITNDLPSLVQEVLKKWWVKLVLWANHPFLVHPIHDASVFHLWVQC